MKQQSKSIRGTGFVMALMAALLIYAGVLAIQRTAHYKTKFDGSDHRAKQLWPDMRIDINRASAAEFSALPGLGPALSQRIVDDRDARGPFQSIDDLKRVNGIGPSTVERIRTFVMVE